MAKKQHKYKLDMAKKIDMIKMSVRAVTRGYKISRLISGCLASNEKITVKVNDELYKKIKELEV